ncbi:MAG: response regulator transcription factor [Dehalococcoidia bacterium]|nr:response regulator transcription factor [Dehalococcoidia bacterium]
MRHALGALLRRQPGIDVAGETALQARIPEDAVALGADIVLVTVDSAERATSPQMRAVYEQLQPIPVVLLNLADDDERLLEALSLGIRGIIDKNADATHLLDALHEVLNGETVISKRLASRLVVEYVASSSGERPRDLRLREPRGSELSERERDVLSGLARGESNRIIAERMYISVHTVRAHVRSLMQKLHVQNRVQAATYAFEHGLVESRRAAGGHAGGTAGVAG